MKEGDKVSFYIDTDLYVGIVKRADSGTADVLTYMGLVCNIPIIDITV